MLRTIRRQPPVDRLKSLDQFRACTKPKLREVARLAEVDQGEILIREGRNDRDLFLILAGAVEVIQAGRRVNALGPCDFFGELGALNRGPRSATVTALSDVEVLVIGPREFDSFAQIPGFRTALLQRMASRIRTVDARLAAADGRETLGGAIRARTRHRPFSQTSQDTSRASLTRRGFLKRIDQADGTGCAGSAKSEPLPAIWVISLNTRDRRQGGKLEMVMGHPGTDRDRRLGRPRSIPMVIVSWKFPPPRWTRTRPAQVRAGPRSQGRIV